MLISHEHESFSHSNRNQSLLFRFGKSQKLIEWFDRGNRLFEKDLHRRVGNDRFSIRTTDKVLNILRDSRDSKSVFSRSFDKTEEEVCRNVVLKHNPRFITDKESLFFNRSPLRPNKIKHIKHRRGFQSFFYITDTEDRKRIININIGIIVEEFSEGSSYIFTELEGDLLSPCIPFKTFIKSSIRGGSFPV